MRHADLRATLRDVSQRLAIMLCARCPVPSGPPGSRPAAPRPPQARAGRAAHRCAVSMIRRRSRTERRTVKHATCRPRQHKEASAFRGVMRWMLLPLVATLVVGCSSDGEALTLDEWAVAVCDSRDALASLPAPTSLADLDAFGRVTDAFDETVTNLDEVSPPETHATIIATSYDSIEAYRVHSATSSRQRPTGERPSVGSSAASCGDVSAALQRSRIAPSGARATSGACACATRDRGTLLG